MTNNGEVDKFDALTVRLKRLASINVERMIRSKHDVDLMIQMRYETLLLKAQMDTMLIILGEKYGLNKDGYALRHYSYLKEMVEQLQQALNIRILDDGSILRL